MIFSFKYKTSYLMAKKHCIVNPNPFNALYQYKAISQDPILRLQKHDFFTLKECYWIKTFHENAFCMVVYVNN